MLGNVLEFRLSLVVVDDSGRRCDVMFGLDQVGVLFLSSSVIGS